MKYSSPMSIKNENIEQHALLICDAHSSHMNEDDLSLLHSNNIDMLILPAYSTSVFQPLDRDLYVPYKNSFRELFKEGGLYSLLYTSRTSFQKTFTAMNITKAWRESRLLETNIEGIVKGFGEGIG